MEKAQLVDRKITMALNELDEDAYYFSAIYLKKGTLSKDAKIKENCVEVRTKFVSVIRLFRQDKMLKSTNH